MSTEKKIVTGLKANEILEALGSIEDNERVVIECLGEIEGNFESCISYEHVNGYFCTDAYNEYWVEDINGFAMDDEGNVSYPDAILLKKI